MDNFEKVEKLREHANGRRLNCYFPCFQLMMIS